MPRVWKVLLAPCGAISLTTVGACKRPNKAAAAPPVTSLNTPGPAALQALLTVDLLGEEVPYFERQAGPAMKVDETWRTYRIGGCTMDVQPQGTKIIGVPLTLDPNCDVDVSKLVAGEFKFPPLHTLTFGTFQNAIGSDVMHAADCLSNCGNRESTDIYAVYEGPHSDDELQVIASAGTYGPPNGDIAAAWTKELRKTHGEQWTDARSYNCGANALDLPAILEPIQVATLTIGRGMKLPQDSACPENTAADEGGSISPTAQTLGEAVAENANDQAWYFMAMKLNRCVAVSVVPGVSTPDDVIASFARDGNPQVVMQRKIDQVLMRSAANADDPGTVVLRGRTHCEVTMAMLKSRHLAD